MKTALFLTSLVLSIISCEAVPAIECQWGPSYWCQNKATAVQCGQEAYCSKEVWKVVPQVSVGTIECDVCELVVKYLDKFVDDNSTEAQAEAAVEKLCDILGSKKNVCDNLVKEFFPQIWEMLVKEADPDTICTALNLCTSGKAQVATVAKVNVGSGECDICKLVAGYLDKFVDNNSTEAEAKAAVEKICDIMGPVKSECEALVDTYFDQIWKMLENQLDPDTICSTLGLCTSGKAQIQLVSGGLECEACKIVANFVDGLVKENKTEAEVQEELEQFCKILGSLKDECDKLLTDSFPTIWNMIVKDLDADTICDELKMCQSRLAAVQEQAPTNQEVKDEKCAICEKVVEALQALLLSNTTEDLAQKEVEKVCFFLGPLKDECKDVIDTYFPQMWQLLQQELSPDQVCKELKLCTSAQRLAVSPVKSMECDVCKIIALYLNKFVTYNGTEDEAKTEVKKLCSLLGSEASECNLLVDMSFDDIWKMVVDETEPDVICGKLQLCTNTSALKDAGLACKDIGVCTKRPIRRKVVAPKQNLCDLCKLLVNFLKPYVDSNSTENEVKQAVESLCSILPGTYKSDCMKLVNGSFDAIWKEIQGELDNNEICKQIGVCNNTLSAARPTVPKLKKLSLPKDAKCDVCKLAVEFLAKYVETNSTEDEVKSALEEVCNILPSSFKTECTSLIDDNFGTIWLLVKSEFDNDLICKQIGLCANSSAVALPKLSPPKASPPKATACDLCKLLVTFLKPYVESNSTEKEVEEALDEICNLLPSSYADQCNTFLDSFFPEIWDIIKGDFDDDEICDMLKLCNSTKSLSSPKPLPVSGSGICDVCKLLISFLKPFADNKTAENETIAAVEKLCTYLPTDYSKECKDMTDKYIRDAWDTLQKEIDDTTLCSDAGFCTNKRTNADELMADIVRGRVKGDELCTVCKLVSSFIREFVENNRTEDEAEKAVADLCNKLPSPYNSTCSSLVDQYFDMIWELIDSYVDDDDLCKQLGVCNSSSVVDLKAEASGPLCILCELVMKELESMLDSNTTEAQIKAALDKVCSLLPKTISEDCDNFVSKYGEDIIKLLLEAVSPKVVCSVLHLCLAEESSVVVMPVVESGLGDDCSTCKLVLGFVKTLVEDYQKPIEGALDDVCNLMPSTIKTECADFVKEFAPAIIQIVDKEIDPQEICKELKLCKHSALMAPWKKLARAKSF